MTVGWVVPDSSTKLIILVCLYYLWYHSVSTSSRCVFACLAIRKLLKSFYQTPPPMLSLACIYRCFFIIRTSFHRFVLFQVYVHAMRSFNRHACSDTYDGPLPMKSEQLLQLMLLRDCADCAREDSGNYTCEVRGKRSSILAAVTHHLYIRGTVLCNLTRQLFIAKR